MLNPLRSRDLKAFVVQDYNLMGLSEFRYSAGFVGLYDGHVELRERAHRRPSAAHLEHRGVI